MFEQLKKRIRHRVAGETSLMYMLISLIGVVTFLMMLSEYNNYLVVRHIEAASDLAAVEAVRAFIDEDELRNERLVIKEEDIPKIRDLYLEKVRKHIPDRSMDIIRIEIPTIEEGKIEIPDDYKTAEFPNSTSNAFVHYNTETAGNDVPLTQEWYLLDGTNLGDCASALVRDTANINTASSKPKTSYIFTTKLTVIYKTLPLFGSAGKNLLNYVDIFTDTPVQLTTVRGDRNVNCITIESEGKVTLR